MRHFQSLRSLIADALDKKSHHQTSVQMLTKKICCNINIASNATIKLEKVLLIVFTP